MKSNNLLTILFLFLLLVLVVLLIKIDKQNSKLKDLETKNILISQNNAALQDSLNMKAQEIQEYSIFVKNLNSENIKLKNREIILKNQFKLLLDSIKVLNEYASVEFPDTNSIVISFEGNKGKITYKGNVVYFIADKTAIHSIDIFVNPVKIESIIFYDKNDKLIKNYIYADGTLIDNANTIIDSTIYSQIMNPKLNKLYNNSIFLLFEYNYFTKFDPNNNLNLGIGYKHKNLMFELKGDFINKNYNFSTKYLFPVFNF